MELQTDVGLAISNHVLLKELGNGSNSVLSPVSIHAVLSLLAAGSKGATRDQFLSFLKAKSGDHLNSLSSHLVSVILADGSAVGGPNVSFANGVWVDQSLPLRQSFKQVVGNVFKAAAREVDFQTKAAEVGIEVNDWADKQTNGVIKEVVPPGAIDNSTRLIFANALYFKGAWNQKFDPSATKDHDFHLSNGGSVRVPFMTSKKKQYVSRFDGFKVLSLPYRQGEDDKRRFSLHIFLPDSTTGLAALIQKMGSESAAFLNHHTPLRKVSVGELRIPKFKISFGFEASDALKELGLVLPFTNQADLTEMVGVNGVAVSDVFHNCFVEVNEDGTEAGAATAAKLLLMCYVEPVDFVADHPFLFLIKEEVTGTVLFCGQILDPSQAC